MSLMTRSERSFASPSFDRKDAGDDALVSMTAGHLVADREMTLGRDVDAHHLKHARRKLVAARQPVDALVLVVLEGVDAVVDVLDDAERAVLRLAVVRM